jgi:lauroyl/myristoyl acyltransferase
MLDALKRGEVVMILADRYVMGASAEIPFFGTPTKMPTGPMSLAQRSGAPVIMAYSWREGPGRQYGAFASLGINTDESLEKEAGSSAPGDALSESSSRRTQTATRVRTNELAVEGQRLFLQALEQAIVQHPEQWVATLWPIWDVETEQ